MNPDFNRQMLNRFAPQEAPEVVQAKMRELESKRARDFDTFLRSLEGRK